MYKVYCLQYTLYNFYNIQFLENGKFKGNT